MYAIVKIGGKQHRVKKGDVIQVELLGKEQGESLELTDSVLFVNDGKKAFVGRPSVKEYVVTADVQGRSKGPKIRSKTYTPRNNDTRTFGHRQHYDQLLITGIEKKKQTKAAAKPAKETPAEEKPAKKGKGEE